MSDVVAQIKSRLAVEDIIRQYIPLSNAGRQLKGRCPFHNEKSPSFYVTPGEGFWKCFGCGKGGDVISFVMEIERMSFVEAVTMLASRAGIPESELTFKREDSGDSSAQLKKGIYQLLTVASRFFHDQLPNNPACEYLTQRGITDATVTTFAIGYAPDVWRHATKAIRAKDQLFIDAGLGIAGKQGVYDRFRGRIMFPMKDLQGRVVAFSGRMWSADGNFQTLGVDAGKYINSPETMVYKKSAVLYGMFEARRDIVSKRRVIVVEGHIDCVLSHQAGFSETVALAGTALTETHAKLIARFTDLVVLALDGDSAGMGALLKSTLLLLREGLTVLAVAIPLQHDPADIILANPAEWEELVSNARDVTLAQVALVETLYGDVRSRQHALREMVYPLILQSANPIARDKAVSACAHILGAHIESVREDLQNFSQNHVGQYGASASSVSLPKMKNEALPELPVLILSALLTVERTGASLHPYLVFFAELYDEPVTSVGTISEKFGIPLESISESVFVHYFDSASAEDWLWGMLRQYGGMYYDQHIIRLTGEIARVSTEGQLDLLSQLSVIQSKKARLSPNNQ